MINPQNNASMIGIQSVPTSQEVFRIRITITLVLDSVPLIGGEVPPRSHLRQMKPWTKRDFEINVQIYEDLVKITLIEGSADTLQS